MAPRLGTQSWPGLALNKNKAMPKLYTVRVLRPCVVNRAPRKIDDVVSEVAESDKNGLLNGKKIEVVDSVDASVVAEKKRIDRQTKDAPVKEPVSKKAAKKAAYKKAE